jgi:sugar O-acyltransferase (sialic acid O-acetyltransferase NeuD family)
MHKPVVIFGVSDTADLAQFYFRLDGGRKVCAFTVDGDYIKENRFSDHPVVAYEKLKDEFPPSKYDVFAPILDNTLRKKKFNELIAMGYDMPSYVSPKATVFSGRWRNSFILENNTIQPFVHLGDNNILWSGNHIGHHSMIGNHCFFASGVVLCGHCIVEDECYLGANCTIKDSLNIAKNTIVGMGAVVLKSTVPNKTYVGSPAREIDR